jgi:hypothetical protein
MTLVLITALYTKEYKGLHQLIINNHVGGVMYVLFGSLLFSVLFPGLKYYWLVSMAFGLTCMLEFIQYFQFPFMVQLTRIKAFAYLFGVSFNPVDFIYYVAGALLSVFVLSAIMLTEVTSTAMPNKAQPGSPQRSQNPSLQGPKERINMSEQAHPITIA